MSQPVSKKRKILAISIISVWLLATVFAFWWFQVKDLRPFDLQMSDRLEDKALTSRIHHLLAGLEHERPEKGYILNFWQPDCNCSRFNQSHVKELKAEYQQQGFTLLTVVRSHPQYNDKELVKIAEEKFAAPAIIDNNNLFSGQARIPAIPAAAIISHHGQLNYFGPYNDGVFCGVGGTDFVTKVAELVVNNEHPNIINTLAYGCYCNWG